jgi:hypothetical protein
VADPGYGNGQQGAEETEQRDAGWLTW